MAPILARVPIRVKLSPHPLALAFAVLWMGAAAGSAQPTETLSADRLQAGMRGYGLSDLGDGRGIQRFDVEILGLLRRYAPRQDLILARVTGAGLEDRGIIAGMSGSPIYVDGKLIGALAYGWPFSKEPICGITPIQSMLDIRQAPAAPPVPIGGPSGSGGAAVSTTELVSAFAAHSFRDHMARLIAPLRAPAGESLASLPLPISFSGSAASGSLFSRVTEAAGWVAAPSGASTTAGAAAPASSLRPGSAVSTVLLSGDMVMAANGTVTWVEGDTLLAFGHPFLSMGPVEMPMAQSEVLTILPSLYRSFKFSGTGAVLGAVTQDRSTGILGTFGAQAPMVPVTVRIASEDVATQTFRFEAVHNSMLTPILTAIAIDNVLTTLEKRTGERTLVWKSVIRTPGREVRWDSVFSGLAAREEAVTSLALLTNYLMANEFRDMTILGVDVEIRHSDRLQKAKIVNVEPRKERLRPGEKVPVWVDLVDFRGGSRRVVMDFEVPLDTPPGSLSVFVGDGSAATAYDLSLYPSDPHTLDQVLDFLARIRPPNSLNLLAYRRAAGAVVAGEALPALPGSVAAILRDRGPGDGSPSLSFLRLQWDSLEQPVPVTGSVRLELEVLPKIW